MAPKRIRKSNRDNEVESTAGELKLTPVIQSVSQMPKLEPVANQVPSSQQLDLTLAKHCSLCGTACIIERSNSIRYGECFFACVHHRNVFAGWVADDSAPFLPPQQQRRQTVQADNSKTYRTAAAVVSQQRNVQRGCVICGHPCTLKVSNSVKNPNRQYLYCCAHPTVFNGWLNVV